MEQSPLARYTPHSSEKSVITGSGSGIGEDCAAMEGDGVGISPPASFAKSETAEKDQVISREVIDVDKDDSAEDLIIVEEKSIQNNKGKISVPSYLSDVDMAPTDIVHSSKDVSPISHNLIIGDESSHDMSFSDDDVIMNDDEFARLQAHFDNFDISPGVEAAIPWWPASEGSNSQGVATSGSAFISPMSFTYDGASKVDGSQYPWTYTETSHTGVHGSPFTNDGASKIDGSQYPWTYTGTSQTGIQGSSFTNDGASKIDGSQYPWTYTGTSQTGVHGSKSIWEPFSVSSSGEKPYNDPWQSASHSSFQQKLNSWAAYNMPPSGTMAPGASDAEAGNVLPSGTPYPPNYKKTKVLQLSKNSSGTKNMFTGWKIQETGELTFPGSDQTQNNFTGGLMGGFSYPQDPLVVLEQGIAAEISVPSDLASSNQKDNSEVLIVKRLESFKKFDTVQDHSDHHYSNKNQPQPSKDWVKKIQEEWRILENDLPDTIFARVYETRMDLLRAVIIGADGTPYHDGIFFFDFHFPLSYPNVPPLVYYRSGGLRLNPNLYNSGKVCLSLLNTWSGDANEKWIPGQSTMLQVLVSIQGLILNAEPYYNEPGYEGMAGTPEGEKWSRDYSENAFLLSLKTMHYSMRQPPKNFENLVFGHFYKRAHVILAACRAYMDGALVGTPVKDDTQHVDEGDKKSCSNIFKMHLPLYINSLVNAFTKIGVSDCEKYTVTVNDSDGAVAEKTSGSNSDGSELNSEQKFDEVVDEEGPEGLT